MTAEEIHQFAQDYPTLVSKIRDYKGTDVNHEVVAKQYNPSEHSVTDLVIRPNRKYIDENGQEAFAEVARLVVPFQKQIVSRAATFLCGNPIQLSGTPAGEKEKRLMAAVRMVWEDNKLDYRSKRLAKLMMAETEAAEIWYNEPVNGDDPYWGDTIKGKFKLRMRVIAPSLGDTLHPVFNEMGDMIAFGRGYKIKIGAGKERDHFDIYTADTIYTGHNDSGTWVGTSVVNPFKKIPVIYYSQPEVEWSDVQSLIDRFEKQICNHADTNDYFASPTVVVSGTVEGYAKKGETGKMLEVSNGASVSYLTWDHLPESLKLELENLIKLIYSGTDTPNISFEEMKSLGVFSGVALKMLFMAAHMKASEKEEIFGESIQRRINFIKAAIGTIDTSMSGVRLSIAPKFEYYLPKNHQEAVETLVNAVQGKIISRQTAIEQNPLVPDASAELERISEQAPDDLDDEMV